MPKYKVELIETVSEKFVMEVRADDEDQAIELVETARCHGDILPISSWNNESEAAVTPLPDDHVLAEPRRPVAYGLAPRTSGPTNAQRAEWAMTALQAFMAITCLNPGDRDDLETQKEQAHDLIVNLLHAFCHTDDEVVAWMAKAAQMFADERHEEADASA